MSPRLISLLLLIALLIGFSCTKKITEEMLPTVNLVVNTATLLRPDAKPRAVISGMALAVGDTINVAGQSKVALLLGSGDAIYINENTQFIVKSFARDAQSRPHLDVALISGEVYSAMKHMAGIKGSFSVSTPTATASIRGTHFDVLHNAQSKQSEIQTLSDTVELAAPGQENVQLAAGNKVVVAGDGSIGKPEAITQADIDHLENWVGKKSIEEVLAANETKTAEAVTAEKPPEWEKAPATAGAQNSLLSDTIRASDPENGPIIYELVSAPSGYKLDKNTGIISFTPHQSGVEDVHIRAVNTKGLAADLEYQLMVKAVSTPVTKSSGKITVVLNAPDRAKPGETITLDASGSKTTKGNAGLSFRFDTKGDGKWDVPGNDQFGAQTSTPVTFEKEGAYTVSVEVKNEDGKTAKVSRQISVNAPPKAVLAITPSSGGTKTDFTIDAGASVAGKFSVGKLEVRFDFNHDGIWDYPASGFIANKPATHRFDKTGTYTVIAEIKDAFGKTDSARAEVTVGEGPVIQGLIGPDSARLGDTIKIICRIKSSDVAIKSYAFTCTGGAIVLPGAPGDSAAKIVAGKEEIVTISCTVTNALGQSGKQDKTIVVANAPASVDALGPYSARVGVPVTVEGKAVSPDSKITQYAWDFKNDGTYAWTSATTSKTQATFNKSGTYTIRLKIKTADGKQALDSALVTAGNTAPTAHAGLDIMADAGQKVKLIGKGSDPDNNIVKYEWDFNGDGVYDWSSATTGVTAHVFKQYAVAKFRVTDRDGATGLDSLRVVICPSGMQTIKSGKFCIDTYEWPDKRGKMPIVNVTNAQAEELCRQARKRLCTANEWIMACQGKDILAYPYGNNFEIDKCNTIGNKWSKKKMAKTGEFEQCVSPYGVYDMSGNVGEWTASGTGATRAVMGGSWENGKRGSECSASLAVDKDKKYFYAGFRCCK